MWPSHNMVATSAKPAGESPSGLLWQNLIWHNLIDGMISPPYSQILPILKGRGWYRVCIPGGKNSRGYLRILPTIPLFVPEPSFPQLLVWACLLAPADMAAVLGTGFHITPTPSLCALGSPLFGPCLDHASVYWLMAAYPYSSKDQIIYQVALCCLPPALNVPASAKQWRLVSPSGVGYRVCGRHGPNNKPMTTNRAGLFPDPPPSLLPQNTQPWRGPTVIHQCHYLHDYVFKMYFSQIFFSSHSPL